MSSLPSFCMICLDKILDIQMCNSKCVSVWIIPTCRHLLQEIIPAQSNISLVLQLNRGGQSLEKEKSCVAKKQNQHSNDLLQNQHCNVLQKRCKAQSELYSLSQDVCTKVVDLVISPRFCVRIPLLNAISPALLSWGYVVLFLSIRNVPWPLPSTLQLVPIEPSWDFNPLISSSLPLFTPLVYTKKTVTQSFQRSLQLLPQWVNRPK